MVAGEPRSLAVLVWPSCSQACETSEDRIAHISSKIVHNPYSNPYSNFKEPMIISAAWKFNWRPQMLCRQPNISFTETLPLSRDTALGRQTNLMDRGKIHNRSLFCYRDIQQRVQTAKATKISDPSIANWWGNNFGRQHHSCQNLTCYLSKTVPHKKAVLKY